MLPGLPACRQDYVNALKVDKRLSGIGLRDIEQLVKARSEAEASAKAAKLAEMQDRPVSEEGERDKEVENLDPNKVEGAPQADGKSTKGVVDSKKGRRPANPEEKKAKRAKAEEEASKGTRKIDCFFSKAPKKVEEQYEEEIGEVD